MDTEENDLQSYENPNYHLNPSNRLYDALNSNTDDIYDSVYQELDNICNIGHGVNEPLNCNVGRKSYATLDIESMGVDINKGPLTQISSSILIDNRRKIIVNADGGGILHIMGDDTNDLYSVPIKKYNDKSTVPVKEVKRGETQCDNHNVLPPGWERHEDNDGSYYWHIKSGTIQREIPVLEKEITEKLDSDCNGKESDVIHTFESSTLVTRSNTSSALDLANCDKGKVNLHLKRRSYPSKTDEEAKDRPVRFAVRSLGWVEILEEDLTPEKSSKAVNKCILDLSLGKNDLLDVVGRWGDGKDLFMDLDEGALKLFDPENLTVLNTQPIYTIRVWGVGRDNGRDFAYVARDRNTRKHMCHVFRCDTPARTIANTLRDICKKIMIERSLHQNLGKTDVNRKSLAIRPTNLPTGYRRPTKSTKIFVSQSFPTPMEEPKKRLQAQYLGCTQVASAVGMDILNESIDRLANSIPQEEWQSVNISIAPSMISIHYPSDDRLIVECRVRYLSFLGIGKTIKYCAFIIHTAQDTFMSHVFYCEPSSGALCKTIEAACKLRYQKCLDAHPEVLDNSSTPGSSIGAALKSIVGSIRGFKNKSSAS